MTSTAAAEVVCSLCSCQMQTEDLESHICSDHLDYYPYGCAYCGHWLATEQLAHFHAQKKQHLPVRIKENVNMSKERRLKQLVELSKNPIGAGNLPISGHLQQQTTGGELVTTWHRNDHTPSSCSSKTPPIRSPLLPSGPSADTALAPAAREVILLNSVPINLVQGNRERPSEKIPLTNDRKEKKQLGQYSAKKAKYSTENEQTVSTIAKEKCSLCQKRVKIGQRPDHIRAHLESSGSLYGCMYCPYQGATPNAVRVHITWRHIGSSTKPDVGVKNLTLMQRTEKEMAEICFGNKQDGTKTAEKSKSNDELVRVSGALARKVADKAMVLGKPSKFSGKHHKRRYLICKQCGHQCLDASVSFHIYQNHINARTAISCPYCDYGSSYQLSEVKRHIQSKHQNMPQIEPIDRRSDYQEEYKKWRALCFPIVSTSRRLASHSNISSKNQQLTQSAGFAEARNNANAITINISDEDDCQGELTSISGRDTRLCALCHQAVTEMWSRRHVWKHLSENEHINCVRCGFPGCDYGTYLKRSLDTHCSIVHHKGKTSDHFGIIDLRGEYKSQFNEYMKKCFNETDDKNEQFGMSNFVSIPDEFANLNSGIAEAETIEAEKGEQNAECTSSLFDMFTDNGGTDFNHVRCIICGLMVFPAMTEDHIWEMHMNGEMPLRCGVQNCGENFTNQIGLDVHWKMNHSGIGNGEILVHKNDDVLNRFHSMLGQCFPTRCHLQRKIIKSEQFDVTDESLFQ